MLNQVGPAWNQELSETQTLAADGILNALCYDYESIQLKRCQQLLSAIGIDPVPKKSDIMKSIKFSRGNDLAFLWFLYDSVYNKCDAIGTVKKYSQNERLLLSCMCHLDMVATLRELDRMLPKLPVKSKPKAIKIIRRKVKYELPYDEPVPKPKIQPVRFFSPPQNPHPKFARYQKYKDSSHIIENEASRWFANELLTSQSQNVARGILCDEISRVVAGKFDREKIFNSMCEKHRIEATKFHRMMTKIMNEKMNPNAEEIIDESLRDFDLFERGVIYGCQLEVSKAETEFRDDVEQYQKRIMMETIVRKAIEAAADLKYIHLCQNCEKCVEGRKISQAIEPCDEVKATSQSIVENEIKFFHRPTLTSPLQFDYEKIFATSFLDDLGVVRNSVNAVLKLDTHLTEDNAISICLRDMWQSELKLWHEKQQRELDERNRIPSNCDGIGKSKQNVFRLLTKALAFMDKNPKFILASLPDAHRLPILREWALRRYGFRYTEKDSDKRWRINKAHRERVEFDGMFGRVDEPSFGSDSVKVCYGKLMDKSREVSRL